MKRLGNTVRGATIAALLLAVACSPSAADTDASGSIRTDDLRVWVSNLASDELEGRATYTAGLGLAAGYIQEHLKTWGVTPAGDNVGYLQTVRVLGVKVTSKSSVTVRVGDETRTFRDGEGVTFARNVGVDRTLSLDRVEFVGYGLDAPVAEHMDFEGKDVRGAAVVWIGRDGPQAVDGGVSRRLLNGRNRYATEQLGALAGVGPDPQPPAASAGDEDDDRAPNAPDFTTTQRLDHAIPPNITASDAFLEFLFSSAPEPYAELKRKADAREPLPAFRLDDVQLTFNIDADYQTVRTELTQNVVGIVRGSDPALNSTYVAVGAHYDHVGYASSEVTDGRRPRAPGRVTDSAEEDRIWNGADDNASGTAALMALARAFAEGPRPKRSLLFVWHAGEERGLWGSRYFVDYPTVPLDSIVTHLNADMIGRNRDDKESESNTVYLVGSDRISTELHEINREANRSLPEPMTHNDERNDPADTEQRYFRTD
ncbi:MAG: M28 family peptidase, partial [Vicinamibacterales bacterium]